MVKQADPESIRLAMDLAWRDHHHMREEALGLHHKDLLPPSTTGIPKPIRFSDAFNPWVQNTSAFILRMHIAVLVFAALYLVGRTIVG